MERKPVKLEKYRAELARNHRRIEALGVRNEKLEKMILEQENLELHYLLQGANMSYQDLTAYIQSRTGQQPVPTTKTQEDKPYEEDPADEDDPEE